MKIRNLILFATAAALSARFASIAETDVPDTPDGTDAAADAGESAVERVGELLARYGDSVAEAAWTLKYERDGRFPGRPLPYKCPSCGGTHYENPASFVVEGKPYRVAAFAVAPDKFVCADPMFRTSVVDRIEIRFKGEAVRARVEASYPSPRNALLLVAEKPVPGVKPLEFAAGGSVPDAPTFFYVARHKGRMRAGTGETSAENTELDIATGRFWTSGMANAILLDASNDVVTVSFRDAFPAGEMDCAPPDEWETAAPDAAEAAAAGLEKSLAATVVPVFVRLDPKAKEERGNDISRGYRSGNSERNERDCVGIVLPGGKVLVVADLDADAVARLDRMETSLPDGTKAPLEFVGALRDYKAILAAFPGGETPAGFEPLRVDGGRLESRFREMLWELDVETLPRAVKLRVSPFVAVSFDEGRGGRLELDDVDEAFLADGSAVQVALPRRLSRSRWESGRETFCGERLAALARAEFAIDPETVPRSGKDRVRIAWFGAEIQELTEEMAREKKAAEFVGSKRDRVTDTEGALVVHVYPGSSAERIGVKEGDVLLFAASADGSVRREIESDRSSRYDGDLDWDEIWEEAPVQYFDRMDMTPWPAIGSEADAVVAAFGIGTRISAEWLHDGEFRTAQFVVEAAPPSFRNAPRARAADLGCIVADTTFEVREFFKLEEGETGVVVTRCKAGSPAAVAGLKPFELVTKVDGKPVGSAAEFVKAVRDAEEVQLTVRRTSTSRVVRVRPKKDAGKDAANAPVGPLAALAPDGGEDD